MRPEPVRAHDDVWGSTVVRFLISIAIMLVANAIGLIVAALILDDMSLNGAAFVLAVVIFTAVEVVAQPLFTKIAIEHARALQGGTALVTTFVALLVTDIFSDGLSISGAVTWLLATGIVWVITLLAGIVLPAIFLKRAVAERRR